VLQVRSALLDVRVIPRAGVTKFRLISIVSGERIRNKKVMVSRITREDAERRLKDLL